MKEGRREVIARPMSLKRKEAPGWRSLWCWSTGISTAEGKRPQGKSRQR